MEAIDGMGIFTYEGGMVGCISNAWGVRVVFGWRRLPAWEIDTMGRLPAWGDCRHGEIYHVAVALHARGNIVLPASQGYRVSGLGG